MGDLARRIIDLRERNNMTQVELAKKINLSKSKMSKIESGDRRVTSDELAALAEVFGVSTDYLLGRPEKHKEDQEELDLEQALDNAHSFSGKPLSDHDRKVAKDVLRSLFQD